MSPNDSPRPESRLVKRSFGDCCRIARTLGMSMGEYQSRDDDSRGLAFTVCGGKLITGQPAPEWLARLNGCEVETIAREAIARGVVERSGRYAWALCQNLNSLS